MKFQRKILFLDRFRVQRTQQLAPLNTIFRRTSTKSGAGTPGKKGQDDPKSHNIVLQFETGLIASGTARSRDLILQVIARNRFASCREKNFT
jgi:hypothetical protein